MFAIIQYRLHQAGHSLDPDAPLRGVEPFTPPLLGSYEVANINGLGWFGPGGYLTMVSLVLLVVAFCCRDTDATVLDLPRLVLAVPGRVRDRVLGRSDGSNDDGCGSVAADGKEIATDEGSEPVDADEQDFAAAGSGPWADEDPESVTAAGCEPLLGGDEQ